MAAMVWSALALAGFVLMAVLIIALVRRKRGGGRTGRGKALLWVLLAAAVVYEVWFYLPRTQLLPADQYGPVSEVQLTHTDTDAADLSDEASGQILTLCNTLRGSRSAFKTLFDPQVSIGEGAYVYFSDQGENRAETCAGFGKDGEKSVLKIRGQVYSVWRSQDLYGELLEVIDAE